MKSLSVCNRVLKVGRGILDIDKDTSVKIVSCGLTNQGCVKVVAETSRTDRSETFMYSTDCQAWITCERS